MPLLGEELAPGRSAISSIAAERGADAAAWRRAAGPGIWLGRLPCFPARNRRPRHGARHVIQR